MEIINPIKLNLAPAVAISTYINPAWVTETWYNIYTKVRREYDGVWHDYQAKYTFYSTNGPPKPPYNDSQWGWRYLGLAAASSTQTYKTDFDLSANAAWSSGSSVLTGQTVFDPADHNDYIALTAITAGSNTVRPSEAVLSSDETIAGYWTLLGAANAWAALDYSLATKTLGITSGAIRATDGGMFLVPANPSVNVITAPNDFSDWGTWNATHSAATEANPTTASSSVSTITATTNGGGIYRVFTGYKAGDVVVFSVWAKSADVATLQVDVSEGDDYMDLVQFSLSSTWQYYQIEYTVTKTGSTVVILLSGMASTGESIKFWGAHFGYAKDCFNRFVLMGVKNCDLVKVAFIPYFTPYDGTPYAVASAHYITDFVTEKRRDTLRSHNRIFAFTDPGDTGSYNVTQTNSDVIYLTNTSAFYLYLSPRNPAKMMEMSSFGVGEATEIAGTEWGVETSFLSFSRKERNETFGTTTFIKRGNAKSIRATAFIDPVVISGDEVQNVLAQFDGVPVFWDFNNPGSTYERLRLFGFHTNARLIIQAETYESLSLDVEGLVE